MGTSEPVNILMVDDQPAKLLSYGAILDDLGENLIKATSGREALTQLLKNDIALVLVDVCMPEMDGFELAAMIRQHPRHQKTAILFISAVCQTDLDRLKGYELGAVDYLPVPVIPEILRAKVSVFVDLYRKTRQLEELNHELERRVEERTVELEATAAREHEARQEAEAALARAQVSESRFHCLVEANIIGIVVSHGEQILETNDAFLRMLGYRREDLLAERLGRVTLTAPDHCITITRAFRVAQAHGACPPFEVEYVRRDGTHVPALVGIVRLEGEPPSYASFVVDLSERQRLEREREAARGNELAVVETCRRLEAFLAAAVHDLRTPLNAVVGYLDLAALQTERLAAVVAAAQEGEEANPTPASRDALLRQLAIVQNRVDEASQGADRLTRLITRLFDLTAIRKGKLEVHRAPCDIMALVRAQVEALRVAAPGRIIRLHTPMDGELTPEFPIIPIIPVEADADRIGQVVANYLTNALKYAPADRPIDVLVQVEMELFMHVSAELQPMAIGESGGGVGRRRRIRVARVAVRDQGPGLPEPERARVWEQFHRVPGVMVQGGAPSGSAGGGLGLGLYICKALVEAHGGQVGVESAVGEGSIFWFSLPLASPPASGDAEAGGQSYISTTVRCT